MWTVALTVTGIVGLWLIPRTWRGWIWYLVNECLWLAYGLVIHSHPVIVMSCVWGTLGVRNLILARRLSRAASAPR